MEYHAFLIYNKIEVITMELEMNKQLLINYILDTYNKNHHFFTRKYFKNIFKIIQNIDVNINLTLQAQFKSTQVYTQEYDLGYLGKYYIDFNISLLLKCLSNNSINVTECSNKDLNLKIIYHQTPDFFDIQKSYNSKIIFTDFVTTNTFYTIIDGNHAYEKNLLLKKDFHLFYLNVSQIPKECYLNDFSYFFHYIITEFYYIFVQNEGDKKNQKRMIKNSKIYQIYSELCL